MGDDRNYSRQHLWRLYGSKRARLLHPHAQVQQAAEENEGAVPPVAPVEEGDEEAVDQQAPAENEGAVPPVAPVEEGDEEAMDQAVAGIAEPEAEPVDPGANLAEDKEDESSVETDVSDSSSICDMDCHYLAEMENEDPQDSDPDPDDPDDPGADDSSSASDVSSSEGSDLEDEDAQNFDLLNMGLDTPIILAAVPTLREMFLLDLALFIRHKHTYESLIDTLEAKNVAFARKHFPTQKKELWTALGRNKAGLDEHVYCSRCGSYIARKKRLGVMTVCPNPGCDFTIATDKAKFFITLSLALQLKHFLNSPGVAELLRYRETRVKHNENAIEDVFDSNGYKELNLGPQDFSGNMNTDGCKIRKGAKLEIYPVFLRVNELPPVLRQKFMFLAAVYVDKAEPKMTSLLKPVVKQLNKLNEEGFTWTNSNGENVNSKFKVLCMCLDGKARHQVLNMSTHQARYGCTYCTISGVSVGEHHTMRWPTTPHPEIPPYEDRTHQGMVDAMLRVENPDHPILGHKGPSPLMLLQDFDLRRSNACDDLHILYECAAKHITELILTQAPRVQEGMGNEALCRVIDERLKKIKTPSKIARKPGVCSIANRKQWKGSEWRNWIVYYAVPCLRGLIAEDYIAPVQYLSYGAFLYSQDIILPEHTQQAHFCFQQFNHLNEELFGLECTKLNLHALLHFEKSVQDNGNLWCYSTFNFESWNHRLMQTVKSPNGAMLQIVVRHLIWSSLQLVIHARDNNISERIRAQITKILCKKRMTRSREVSAHVYLMGKFVLRPTSEEEREVLAGLNLLVDRMLLEYKKISINSSEYRSLQHVQEGGHSDDSLVYTYADTFCSIQSVVQFHTEAGEAVCGLFVKEHTVVPRLLFQEAQHIACLRGADEDLLHFIRPEEVRCPVIKMPLHGEVYVVPLTNLFEID